MALILDGTNGLSDVDGTAATPAIRGTDTNTGIFFPAADTIAFSEGGVESMRIDGSGRVLIGSTSNPFNSLLYVTGTPTSNQPIISAYSQGGANVSGIGLYNDAASVGIWSQSGALTFRTNGSLASGSETMRIDSGGNVLVGKTANNQTSAGIMFGRQENGAAPLSDWVKTFSGTVGSIRNWHNGTYVGGIDFSNTATSFPTSSDVRLKKDITEAPSASAKIDQIRVVSHGWVHDDSVVEFGVIAQELYEVAEQSVTKGDDGIEVERTWTVDYSKLVPMLIKAHQEQQAAIQELKSELDSVKATVDLLSTELATLKGAA
jgi:hypothetical protein